MSETKKKTQIAVNDGITAVTPVMTEPKTTPRVTVFIPLPPEAEDGSVKVDPYEHVTINGEKPVYVKRGEPVDVPVPVYLQLRNKYPRL